MTVGTGILALGVYSSFVNGPELNSPRSLSGAVLVPGVYAEWGHRLLAWGVVVFVFKTLHVLIINLAAQKNGVRREYHVQQHLGAVHFCWDRYLNCTRQTSPATRATHSITHSVMNSLTRTRTLNIPSVSLPLSL